jgi:zinc protease
MLFAGLLFGAVIAARPAPAQVFDPTTFRLDNGLEVVVVTNHRVPVVTQMIWYKVGAADEPPGKSGIAHFLEHLMFKGTETLAPGEFSKIVAANGGRENAFTSHDFTGYFQTVAKDRLEMMMKHEADRMTNLVLSDEVVLPERDVVIEERRSRIDNEPASQLGEMASAALYLNHPYGRPIIGWEHELRNLTSEDALDFYRRWYAPNNAVLIIAGDVEPAEVRDLAETYYGAIPARAVPPRQRLDEPRHWAPRRIVLESPQVGRPSVSIRYVAPSLASAEGGEAYALTVLSEVLGGATGRLYRSLVVEQKVAVSANSHYSGTGLDSANFRFWAAPTPDGNVEEIEAALRREVEKLLDQGVDADEVARAKQRLLDDAVFARDDVSRAARVIGRSLASGLDIDDVENWPNRIRQVTPEAVDAAARAVFRDERSVTGVLIAEPTS